MKGGNYVRKFTFGLIVVTLFILMGTFFNDTVYAKENTNEEVAIHVSINDDGSAHFTHYFLLEVYDGTEYYMEFTNIDFSMIEDVKVSEDGQQFELIDNWDLQASLEEKAFKAGMIPTNEGLELSWGLGEYGRHEFVVEYVITNFIKQVDDAQMIYWEFVKQNSEPMPEKMTIEIEANEPFTRDNIQVWDADYPGKNELIDGKIVVESDEPFTPDNYVLLIARINDGMFSPYDVFEGEFLDYLTEFQVITSDRKNTAQSFKSTEDISDETDDTEVEASEDSDEQDNNTATEHDTASEPDRNKWDDDEVEKDFGYLLSELLKSIIDFFKSLFN